MLSDHGNLMVGIDYLQQNLGLPLQTIKAAAAILAAILVIAGTPQASHRLRHRAGSRLASSPAGRQPLRPPQ